MELGVDIFTTFFGSMNELAGRRGEIKCDRYILRAKKIDVKAKKGENKGTNLKGKGGA